MNRGTLQRPVTVRTAVAGLCFFPYGDTLRKNVVYTLQEEKENFFERKVPKIPSDRPLYRRGLCDSFQTNVVYMLRGRKKLQQF